MSFTLKWSHGFTQPCTVHDCGGSNHPRRSIAARRLTPANGRMLVMSTAGPVNIWRNLGEALASKYLEVWSSCPSTSMMRSARGSGWLNILKRSSQDEVRSMSLWTANQYTCGNMAKHNIYQWTDNWFNIYIYMTDFPASQGAPSSTMILAYLSRKVQFQHRGVNFFFFSMCARNFYFLRICVL